MLATKHGLRRVQVGEQWGGVQGGSYPDQVPAEMLLQGRQGCAVRPTNTYRATCTHSQAGAEGDKVEGDA